ncbi:hypothetical protein D3C76_1852690 [compost metagenome]
MLLVVVGQNDLSQVERCAAFLREGAVLRVVERIVFPGAHLIVGVDERSLIGLAHFTLRDFADDLPEVG